MKTQIVLQNQELVHGKQKSFDFWQILEQKSAFTEGILAQDILFWNQFLDLKISAGMFVATGSPLSDFFLKTYLPPIRTELDYIETRVKLISDCKKLLAKYPKDSSEFENYQNLSWLLKFQLYGFGQKLIADGKILYGLISLKEVEGLNQEKVREKLKKLAKESPKYSAIISEFI